MLDYIWKRWISKIPACVGGSLLGAVETGAKLILALKSVPKPVQSSAVVQWEILCFIEVMSNLGRSPGFLNNMVCCYLFWAL